MDSGLEEDSVRAASVQAASVRADSSQAVMPECKRSIGCRTGSRDFKNGIPDLTEGEGGIKIYI
ncbi:hypothetical protein B6K86_07955 [Lachnospiraceae bacterium]|nr:hypothetical protein B6K86_07955 [Lachnospiraceae bacterium]